MKQLRHELKHWLAVVLLFVLGTSMAGAYELKVNEGTDDDGRLPVYGIYAGAYQRCEFVMEASLLEGLEGVKINKLTFFIQSGSSDIYIGNTQVFMKEVPFTEYTSKTYAGQAGSVMVYEGAIDATGDELTVTFTKPYEYKGGNLLIGMYVTEMSLQGGTFRVYGTKVNKHTGLASYSFSTYAAVDNDVMKNYVDFLPTMIFDIENAPHTISYNDHDGKVSMTFAGAEADNTAKVGTAITATATVEEGYALNNVRAVPDDVTITTNADGTYSFTMPNHSIHIESDLLRDIAVKVDVTEPLPLAEGEPLRFAIKEDGTADVAFVLKDVIDGEPGTGITKDTHYSVSFDKALNGVGKYKATFTGIPEGGYINSFDVDFNIQKKHTVPVAAGEFGTQFYDNAVETFDDIDLATVTAVTTDGKATITKLAEKKVAKKYPFLIYNPWGEEDGKSEFTLWETVEDLTPANPTPASEYKGTDGEQEFTAAQTAAKDYYVLQKGREFVYVIGAGTKPEHRCWIELEKVSGARILTIAIDQTTGISDVKAAQIVDGIYDLQGRRLTGKPSQRGMYVIDGKKVVVK